MSKSSDIYKKLSQEYSAEELAESFVFPHDLTEKEKQEADAQLWAERQKRLQARSPEERVYAGLLTLKYQVKAQAERSSYEAEKGVTHFLSRYIQIVQRKQKQLAEDIAIHPTRLSRILNGKEKLSLAIAYRLEIHSGEVIPAIFWWKLVQQEIEHDIRTDSEAKQREGQHVKKVGFKRAS